MKSIIQVKNLTKTFYFYKKSPGVIGSIKGLFKREKLSTDAVNNISFDVQEGEFIGFVGPNGAGKTTTLKMLSGILFPTSGEVEVMGFKPFQRKSEFQKQFTLVMGQKNQLWWDLPPIESFQLNKQIYEIPDERYEENLKKLTELLNIEDILNVQVRKLSLGQRMKCELTGALLHSPKVVFLDEPTIGLDVISQKNIRDFLLEYNKKSKATILLTSHYMEDIRQLADRVIIIDHGNILYDGKYDELTSRYADTKRLDITLTHEMDPTQFKQYGNIIQSRPNAISLAIPRARSAKITAEILEKFTIEDISIHEQNMEDIIAEIFRNKSVKQELCSN